jgi:hypothetical protein
VYWEIWSKQYAKVSDGTDLEAMALERHFLTLENRLLTLDPRFGRSSVHFLLQLWLDELFLFESSFQCP